MNYLLFFLKIFWKFKMLKGNLCSLNLLKIDVVENFCKGVVAKKRKKL